jgi:argininosuccinate lyase
VTLNELSLDELKAVSDIFDETVYKAISVETCVNARNLAGGPAEAAVLNAVKRAEDFLSGVRK